jgi:hypothetical protein
MKSRLLTLTFACLATLGLGYGLSLPTASARDYGQCSFDSDCHPGTKCNSSRCADSAGSKCSFDSDCGGHGAKCNSSKCSNAPDGKCSFDSECPGGRCSSSKCTR